MRGSSAGVAESITVAHRYGFERRSVHVIDLQWTDACRNVHGRRRVIDEDHLRCPHRAAHVVSEVVPGVGVVRVDCSVPRKPDEELVWRAELIREGDLWARAHGAETRTFPLPIDWEDDSEELVG